MDLSGQQCISIEIKNSIPALMGKLLKAMVSVVKG